MTSLRTSGKGTERNSGLLFSCVKSFVGKSAGGSLRQRQTSSRPKNWRNVAFYLPQLSPPFALNTHGFFVTPKNHPPKPLNISGFQRFPSFCTVCPVPLPESICFLCFPFPLCVRIFLTTHALICFWCGKWREAISCIHRRNRRWIDKECTWYTAKAGKAAPISKFFLKKSFSYSCLWYVPMFSHSYELCEECTTGSYLGRILPYYLWLEREREQVMVYFSIYPCTVPWESVHMPTTKKPFSV